MDGTILVESNAAVEVACSAKQVKATSLAIVALIGLIHLGLSEHQHLRAQIVPLDGGLVGLEERFLARGGPGETRQTVYLYTCGCALHELMH